MHWIIQENLWNEQGFNEFLYVLREQGQACSIVKVIPFSDELDPPLASYLMIPGANVLMVFGSTTLCKIAKNMGLWPGVFHNINFSQHEQIRGWGQHMLNADAYISALVDIDYSKLGDDLFCRPDGDTKMISGHVTTKAEVAAWVQTVIEEHSNPATRWELDPSKDLFVFATPKNIHQEYRVWMVEGVAVTATLYKHCGRPLQKEGAPTRVLKFAEYLDSVWSPGVPYCVDIALIDGDLHTHPKVIEVNCLNASGFYKANLNDLVKALRVRYGR